MILDYLNWQTTIIIIIFGCITWRCVWLSGCGFGITFRHLRVNAIPLDFGLDDASLLAQSTPLSPDKTISSSLVSDDVPDCSPPLLAQSKITVTKYTKQNFRSCPMQIWYLYDAIYCKPMLLVKVERDLHPDVTVKKNKTKATQRIISHSRICIWKLIWDHVAKKWLENK